MPRINVLAYESNGIPRMLSTEAEIVDAILRGDIAPDTSVTLYLDDGERRFGPADTQPELSDHFATSELGVTADGISTAPAALPTDEETFGVSKPKSPWTLDEVPSATYKLQAMPTVVSHAPLSPAVRAVETSMYQPSVPVTSRASDGHTATDQSIWTYMFLPYQRYADFEGRACRKEYWAFSLMIVVVIIALSLNFAIVGEGSGAVLLALFCLASFIPALAVQVRRFHDIGVTGWAVLLGLIPYYVGGIIVLVLMLIEGNRGANRFGADPRGAVTASRSS